MPPDPSDVQKLQSWNFLRDYTKRRPELLKLARASFLLTRFLIGNTPTPADCETLYNLTLKGSAVFRGMLARKRHLPPAFYDAMCLALSRYVLHTDWSIISN